MTGATGTTAATGTPDPGRPAPRQRIRRGTARRILTHARRYRGTVLLLLAFTAVDALITAISPLMLGWVIDDGIMPRRTLVVIQLSLAVAALALLDAVAMFAQTWFSARIGQGLIHDLRTTVFRHVQRQSLAFFTRTQTGSLVSRLSTDVVGAQQALTSLLTQAFSTVLTLTLVLGAMFYLSWQISILMLLVIPVFLTPFRLIGRRLQHLTREGMQLDAEMGSLMNERFNVSGALLAKLYGRPAEESDLFSRRADRVRTVAIRRAVLGRAMFVIAITLAALATALVYGVGGVLAVHGTLRVGTLVALVALLTRLYGPLNQLASLQTNVVTSLVSFDRVFEVLDLQPAVTERPGARPLPTGAAAPTPGVEFDGVWFRYPRAEDVSLASLEPVAAPESAAERGGWVLQDVNFQVPAGSLTALVGPSGAGKTTITQLLPRLYDADRGAVRIGGHDTTELTLESLHAAVGVVTQETHLFHDTLRANLLYARPDAAEADLVAACTAARIQDMVDALPDGLDAVVGDRGLRLSGGEKQRIALARLLLKSPPIVVLDEATAHLDSESEQAIQRALKAALAGRTCVVIAHRLSTIREADQILVVDRGRIRERGTHAELLAADGVYAELYRAQFLAEESGEPAARPDQPDQPDQPAADHRTELELGRGTRHG